MVLKESKCIGLWLHDYQITGNFKDCVEEVCTRCRKTKIFPVRNGKPNAVHYYKHHQRQTLQKWHKLYNNEYPKE